MDNPFDESAEEYDAWFDEPEGRCIFLSELECLRPLIAEAARPLLEVGVGTGRFARALGVEEGIDPSLAMLRMAAARGIRVRQASGESLPYRNGSFGGVLMVATVCFLSDPRLALAEAARVLRAGGRLVAGVIPVDSPWGREYARKGREGHRIYSRARFYTLQQVIELARAAGFRFEKARSCLHTPPGIPLVEDADCHEGLTAGAGFIALAFRINEMLAPET